MNAHKSDGAGRVVVGGKLVNKMIPPACREKLGAVVEAGGICGVHDMWRGQWVAESRARCGFKSPGAGGRLACRNGRMAEE